MKISYTTRNGQKIERTFTIENAKKRLAYLEEQEAVTQQFAPTDSGDVRDSYLREAQAIRNILN